MSAKRLIRAVKSSSKAAYTIIDLPSLFLVLPELVWLRRINRFLFQNDFFLNLFIKIYFFKVFLQIFFSVFLIYFSLNLFNMKIVFATTRNLIQN